MRKLISCLCLCIIFCLTSCGSNKQAFYERENSHILSVKNDYVNLQGTNYVNEILDLVLYHKLDTNLISLLPDDIDVDTINLDYVIAKLSLNSGAYDKYLMQWYYAYQKKGDFNGIAYKQAVENKEVENPFSDYEIKENAFFMCLSESYQTQYIKIVSQANECVILVKWIQGRLMKITVKPII